MTEQEILNLIVLDNDDQLDEAINYLDEYLDSKDLDFDNPNFNKLSDLIEEYEDRTDILNREVWHGVAKKVLDIRCFEDES